MKTVGVDSNVQIAGALIIVDLIVKIIVEIIVEIYSTAHA